jgi:hypothetical protein
MKAIALGLAAFFALCLVPNGESSPRRLPAIELREKIYLSRQCTGSRWYLVDSDDVSVTMECDAEEEN